MTNVRVPKTIAGLGGTAMNNPATKNTITADPSSGPRGGRNATCDMITAALAIGSVQFDPSRITGIGTLHRCSRRTDATTTTWATTSHGDRPCRRTPTAKTVAQATRTPTMGMTARSDAGASTPMIAAVPQTIAVDKTSSAVTRAATESTG